MSYDPQQLAGNQMLDATPLADLEVLAPDLEWVKLKMRQVISEPGQPLEHAYFPISGLCSAIALANIDDPVEMGLVVKEGFLDVAILLMAKHDPFRMIV